MPENGEAQEPRNWILDLAARLVPQVPDGWHRYVMPVGVLTLLATWIMMGELDSLLEGMQGVDGASHGMSALTTGSPDQKTEALEVWASWDRFEFDSIVSSAEVRATYLWVDFGFLVAYSVVLLGAIGGLWRRSEGTGTGVSSDTVSRSRPWLQVINGLGYVLLALIVLDLVENIGLLIWPRVAILSGLLPNASVWLSDVSAWTSERAPWMVTDLSQWDKLAATAVSWSKLGAGVALMVGLAYVATVAFRPGDFERQASSGTSTKYRRSGTARMQRWIRGASLFRVPLILLALLTVLMLAVIPMGFVNQVPDLIRRWTPWHFVVTLIATVGVIAAVWVVSSYAERRYLGKEKAPERRRSLTVIAALALVGVGIAQFFTFRSGISGWGALVPAVFVAVLVLAQRILPDPPDRQEESPRIVASGTSRVLAASVLVLLGASMLNAAVPELIDPTRVWLPMSVVLTIGVVVIGLVSATASVGVAGLLRRGWKRLTKRGVSAGRLIVIAIFLTTLLGVPLLPDPSHELPLWLSLVLGITVTYSAVGIYLGLDDPVLPLASSRDPESRTQAPTGVFFEETDDQLQFSLSGKTIGLVGMVCAIGATVWILVDPTARAPRVGGAAIVMLALAQLAIIGLLLTQFADHAKDPDAFAWLGFKRIPVFLFLFGWIAVVAIVPSLKLDSYHDVRMKDGSALSPLARTPSDSLLEGRSACLDAIDEKPRDAAYVFERWKCINVDVRVASNAEQQAVPLVIVSSWGGGIRAGVWASMVMDCLFEQDTPFDGCEVTKLASDPGSEGLRNSDRILGLSGVSGGTLGFVEYAAHVADRTTGRPANSSWVEERLTDDYVSPTLAWMLYLDMPLHLLGFIDGVPDRADVLEEAWERSWGEEGTLSQGLVSMWESNPRVPMVLANGTSFSDDCGFVSAPIAGASRTPDGVDDCRTLLPGTDPEYKIGSFVGSKDLLPYLCDGQRDVRLSTAALLSARFPYVTPSGRLVRDCGDGVDEISYIIDGGYREGSGALTALQLWDAIEEAVWEFNATSDVRVVPFMIHIENGYSPPTPQARTPPVPNEWLVPSQGRVGNGLVTVSRATAAARFNEPVRSGSRDIDCKLDGRPLEGRYMFITTRAHPGVTAPLGWTLSEESFRDLEKQLKVNEGEIAQVHSWLNGSLMCEAERESDG